MKCREKIGSKVHARVADTVACFRIGFDYCIRFLSFCFPTVDLEIYREEFEKIILKLAEEQGIYTDQAFKQVMKFCEGQNVNFTVSPQALSKVLAEEGIIQVKNGQNTYTKRYGDN